MLSHFSRFSLFSSPGGNPGFYSVVDPGFLIGGWGADPDVGGGSWSADLRRFSAKTMSKRNFRKELARFNGSANANPLSYRDHSTGKNGCGTKISDAFRISKVHGSQKNGTHIPKYGFNICLIRFSR